jgi:hypothetical protein
VFDTRGEDPRDHALEIENAAGDVVLRLSFTDVFDIRSASMFLARRKVTGEGGIIRRRKKPLVRRDHAPASLSSAPLATFTRAGEPF